MSYIAQIFWFAKQSTFWASHFLEWEEACPPSQRRKGNGVALAGDGKLHESSSPHYHWPVLCNFRTKNTVTLKKHGPSPVKSVQRRIRHRYTPILIAFNRYDLYLAPCGIWRWVINLGFENRTTRLQNLQLEIVKFLKKSNVFKPRSPVPFFQTLVCVVTSRTGACQSFHKMTRAYSKEWSYGDGFLNRIY
jgi:hypothetical protein